jgi:hypothetical protein
VSSLGCLANATSSVLSAPSSIAAKHLTRFEALSNEASYKRRRQDWEYQKGLAERDIAIAIE